MASYLGSTETSHLMPADVSVPVLTHTAVSDLTTIAMELVTWLVCMFVCLRVYLLVCLFPHLQHKNLKFYTDDYGICQSLVTFSALHKENIPNYGKLCEYC